MAHCSLCTAPDDSTATASAAVHPELHFVRYRKSLAGTVLCFRCDTCEAEVGCLVNRGQAAQRDWRVCFDPAAMPALAQVPPQLLAAVAP